MSVINIFKKKNKINLSPATAVFTTKKIMTENEQITKVYHGIDDSFDFFDKYLINSNENIMPVSFQKILEQDPGVSTTINIPQGYCASRETTNDKWIIEPCDEGNDE